MPRKADPFDLMMEGAELLADTLVEHCSETVGASMDVDMDWDDE